MNTPNRNIPLPIKRAVRQRCGFGCVICGLPLYEYEHMEGWAKAQRHVAEEITLLCDRHHRERTNGLLPLQAVREADADPFNLRAGVSPPYNLHYSGTGAVAIIGGNMFGSMLVNGHRVLAPIIIDQHSLVQFRLEDGHLLLSLYAYDLRNRLLLAVEDNELRYSVPGVWDYELVGRALTVRLDKRLIFLEVEFAVPSTVVVRRGMFLYNGVHVEVTKHQIAILNNQFLMASSGSFGANAGIVIGEAPPGVSGVCHMPHVPRNPVT